MARAAYPDDWEQRELDGQMLYDSAGGIPHGRLPIADGAIKKADVISTARQKSLRPSNSASHRRTVQENIELKRHNESLQNTVDIHQQLILVLANLCTYFKLVVKRNNTILMLHACS